MLTKQLAEDRSSHRLSTWFTVDTSSCVLRKDPMHSTSLLSTGTLDDQATQRANQRTTGCIV